MGYKFAREVTDNDHKMQANEKTFKNRSKQQKEAESQAEQPWAKNNTMAVQLNFQVIMTSRLK